MSSTADPAARPAREVERVFDVALAGLLDDGVFHEERWTTVPRRGRVGDDGSFPICFFEVAGETVWGATARVLVELCSLCSRRRLGRH